MALIDLLPPNLRAKYHVIKAVAIGLLLLSLLGIGFWAGYDYRDLKADRQENKALESSLKALSREIELNNRLQQDLTKVSIDYNVLLADRVEPEVRYVTREVVREVEKPIYSACIIPSSGVQLYNDAVRRYNETRD